MCQERQLLEVHQFLTYTPLHNDCLVLSLALQLWALFRIYDKKRQLYKAISAILYYQWHFRAAISP